MFNPLIHICHRLSAASWASEKFNHHQIRLVSEWSSFWHGNTFVTVSPFEETHKVVRFGYWNDNFKWDGLPVLRSHCFVDDGPVLDSTGNLTARSDNVHGMKVFGSRDKYFMFTPLQWCGRKVKYPELVDRLAAYDRQTVPVQSSGLNNLIQSWSSVLSMRVSSQSDFTPVRTNVKKWIRSECPFTGLSDWPCKPLTTQRTCVCQPITRSTQRAQTSLAEADHYSHIAHYKNVEPWLWKTTHPP